MHLFCTLKRAHFLHCRTVAPMEKSPWFEINFGMQVALCQQWQCIHSFSPDALIPDSFTYLIKLYKQTPSFCLQKCTIHLCKKQPNEHQQCNGILFLASKLVNLAEFMPFCQAIFFNTHLKSVGIFDVDLHLVKHQPTTLTTLLLRSSTDRQWLRL